VQLTFSDSDHGSLCIRDIDYACTSWRQAESQRSYPALYTPQAQQPTSSAAKILVDHEANNRSIRVALDSTAQHSKMGTNMGRTSEW